MCVPRASLRASALQIASPSVYFLLSLINLLLSVHSSPEGKAHDERILSLFTTVPLGSGTVAGTQGNTCTECVLLEE